MALNYVEKTPLKGVYQQIRDNLNKTLVSYHLKALYKDSDNIVNIREAIDPIITPEELFEILKFYGWNINGGDLNENYDENTYCYFAHEEYNFTLTMQFNGFNGTLKLYRSDI